MKENYKSDLCVNVQLTLGGEEVVVPSHDFMLRFYTTNGRQVPGCRKTFDCKKEGDVWTNCKLEDGKIVCYLDNHGLPPGQLCVEYYDYAPDENFADGNQLKVVPSELDIELVLGAGDNSVTPDVEVYLDLLSAVSSLATDFAANYIVDNLSSTASDKALSAKQGKVLNDILTEHEERLDDVESESGLHEARIITLERAGLVDNESVMTPDHTLAHYGIVGQSQTYPKYSAYNSRLYTLLGYNVTGGDVVEIKVESSTAGGSWARVYAFYNITSLDNNGTPLISAATRVDAGEVDRFWDGTASDDVVTVPVGAKMLVVTQIDTLTNKLSVKSRTPQGAASLFPRVAALEATDPSLIETRVDALEDTVEELSDVVYIHEQTEIAEEDTGIDYTVHTGGTGYLIGTNGIVGETWVYTAKNVYGYQLLVYEVSVGDKLHISRPASGGGTSGTKSWAFYSAQDAEHILTGTKISVSTVDTRTAREDDVTVPSGANMLVVSYIASLAKPVVSKYIDTPINGMVEEIETRVDVLEESVADLEDAQAITDNIGKLSVKREASADFVGVAYNRGDGYELCYRLARCFTSGNNTMGFGGAGYRQVDRIYSDATGVYYWNQGGGVTTLELGSTTDIIGPIAYQGYNDFLGGAHSLHYADGVQHSTTPTSQTQEWAVLADGVAVAAGASVMCNEVKLTVTNKIRRPDDNVITNGLVNTGQAYNNLIPFAIETQEITIQRDGTVKVHVTIAFENDSIGKTIKTYYGMQSTFRGDKIITIGGKYDKFVVNDANFVAFKKADYPRFNRFVEVKSGWLQSAWLRPDVGIGDHRYLASNDDIFRKEKAASSKYYHSIIGENYTLAVTSGLTLEWEGIYQWLPNAAQAAEIIEMAAASNTYTREESDARYYTREQINAMLNNQ